MSSGKSSKQPVASGLPESSRGFLGFAVLFAIVLLMSLTTLFAGWRRGEELMPWPDGLECAAAAMNLTKGRGAVLHFGGYTYPSRYTGGYPLILEFFRRVFGGNVSLLPDASAVIAMLSVLAIFFLARMVHGRLASLLAALLLGYSPIFLTYSL